jgi:recombinational DNA repair protein (RecF pathway)
MKKMEEVESLSKYADLIKNKCAGCGTYIPATMRHYMLTGNFCTECVRRINARVVLRASIEELHDEIREKGLEKVLRYGKNKSIKRLKYILKKRMATKEDVEEHIKQFEVRPTAKIYI